MKQSKRFLSVLLAMIMIFSTFTIGVSAYKTDYSEPAGYDSILTPYFNNDQAASALLDYLDTNVFAEMDVHESVVGIDINIVSFDTLCDSVDEIFSSTLYKIGNFFLDLGDIEDMSWSKLRDGNNRRRNPNLSDFQFFLIVLSWAKDNYNILCKAADGSLDLGFIERFWSLSDEVPMLKNLHGYLCNMIYELLITDGEPTGYKEGDPDSYVLDDIVQDFINNRLATFIFGLLDDEAFETVNEYVTIPLHKNEDGKYVDKNGNPMGLLGLLPSLKASDISITATSTYDFVINIFNALIDDIVIPSGGKIILDLLEIPPEDPSGDTTYIDVAINLFVDYQTLVDAGVVSSDTPEEEVNVIEEFLRWKGVENPAQPKPIDKINTALEYILKVGLKKFIHFEGTPGVDSHLQLTEYFAGMFSDLIKMVIPMLPSLVSDFTPLTAEEEAAIDTMEDEQLFAFLLKMVLEAFVDGVYFPDGCDTIRELATYTLINVCEELVHDQNVDFQAMIDNGSLDPNSDQCLDVAASVLNYYLVGQTTYESSNKKPTFVQLLNGCFETFLGKYVSLFSMYPNASDKQTYANNPWYKLYMSVNQWIPLTNIIYGVEDSWQGMQNLVMDSIIGNILDFNINGLLGIIGRRHDSDLNKPLSKLLANLIARVLNGVFKLPVEGDNRKGDNSFQLNKVIIPYDYTRLDQVVKTVVNSSTAGYTASLNGTGLKNTVKMLLYYLPNITQDGAVAHEALDLIAELIGIIDLDQFDYMKRQYVNNFSGSYSMNDLKALYEEFKIPSNDGIKYYEDNYTFCHTVDFDPWTYKDFKSALGDAKALIDAYDKGKSVKRADITYAYYVLQHVHDDWLLANQPAADNFYLAKIMNANPRINSNVNGSGDQIYTNRSWDAYVKAYDFAQIVMAEYNDYKNHGTLGDYPQSKVNTARAELRDAIRGLKLNAGLGDADYSALYDAINNLKFLSTPAIFTSKSVQSVVEAYNEALAFYKEVWYDADGQQVVDGITDRLTKAYDLLVNIATLSYIDESMTFFKTDEVNSYLYGLEEAFYTEEQAAEYGEDFTFYMNDWFLGYGTNGADNLNLIPTANGNGTGAKVQLRSDEDGDGIYKTEREYTVIYFGDVNGDGNVDGQDAVIIKCFASRLLAANASNTHITFAGDVDCDDFLSTRDATSVEKAGVYKEVIDQAPSARADNTIAFTDLVNGVLD